MSRSPSFKVKTELSPSVDSESLKRWVVAFCAIRFDLEQGQLVEECYPHGVLSHDEELEIAYSSFPDSVSQHQNRSSIHDCIFFFRICRNFKPPTGNGNATGGGSLEDRNKCFEYLYGYVFNRQRHDERLKRGGEQISVVILSHRPL